MGHLIFVCLAGLLAGTMNALAGGGSFVALPSLVAVGVPSVSANASSTFALYPAGLASAWVYRDGLRQVCGVPLRPTLIVTLIGGFAGSLLLLWTPGTLFDRVLPWLLLVATLALAFGRQLGPALRARVPNGVPAPIILLMQLVLGVYGGYFGGGVGLMMTAAWSMLDGADIKALNAPRTLMVSAANTVAMLCFVVAGAISWPSALALGAGAIAGGYGGAHIGRRLDPTVVRAATITLAVSMTIVFFVRACR
jgi:uncharacterized membrane protein YfcA